MAGESKEQMSQTVADFWTSSIMAKRLQQKSEHREQALVEVTQRMFEAAGLKPGDRVLDIAAGTGEQGRQAARRVEPGGSVLITDLSAEMLDMAQQAAAREGLTNVSTRVMNAEQLDLEDESFDAVICRYALMAMPRLQQVLSEIRRVLKPGGKFAAIVTSAPEKNPLFHLLTARRAKEGGAPVPDHFSLADPSVFEGELKGAGFREVMTQTISYSFQYPSLDAALQFSRKQMAFDQTGSDQQEKRLEEMRQTLSPFEGPQGLIIPSEALLGVGTK